MKIAILTPTLHPYSGIDRVVEQNARQYVEKKNTVKILCLKASMRIPGVEVVELGMPKSALLERLYRLLFFVDVVKIWKASALVKDADLVISHQYPMNLVALLAQKRFKRRYLYYDAGIAYPKLFGSVAERTYLRLFRFLTNLTARPANDAISISGFLKKVLKKETGLESTVRYVDIDKERFNRHIDAKQTEAVRNKHKLGNKVLLYIGRISPHKNVHGLIEAFSLVKKEMPEAQLVIVGKHTFGSYTKQLEKIRAAGVIFAGFVPDEDLPGYYGASSLYVTASLWEGFDMPCVEAQECGKRVVAFDVGSHPEVVKSGTLVSELTAEALSKGILAELKKN